MANRFKTWISKAWKTVVATIGVATTVWLIFQASYFITDWLHQEDLMKKYLENIQSKLDEIIKLDKKKDEKIESFEKYIDKKRQSFQVGFRVFKETDSTTGTISYKKMYRGWDGHWHEVHYDEYYSSQFGYDFYFYVDRQTGEKIYVN